MFTKEVFKIAQEGCCIIHCRNYMDFFDILLYGIIVIDITITLFNAIDFGIMCAADNLARLTIETNIFTEGSEYWLNCRIVLIPASFDKPHDYGHETTRIGGTADEYYKNVVVNYKYDDRLVYTDKIIKVSIDPINQDIVIERIDSLKKRCPFIHGNTIRI